MDLCFSITFCDCDLVHYHDLHFLVVSENCQNSQLTLTENYGLFLLFAFPLFLFLPFFIFPPLLGKRGIYFYNHTHSLPWFLGPLEICISFRNMFSMLGLYDVLKHEPVNDVLIEEF